MGVEEVGDGNKTHCVEPDPRSILHTDLMAAAAQNTVSPPVSLKCKEIGKKVGVLFAQILDNPRIGLHDKKRR